MHPEHAADGEHVALNNRVGASINNEAGAGLGNSRIRQIRRIAGAEGERRDEGVFGELKPCGLADHAFLILRLDLLRRLEQALEAVHEVHVRLRVEAGHIHRCGRQVVAKHLAGLQHVAKGLGAAGAVHGVVNVLEHPHRVGFDVRRQHRHCRFKNLLREVEHVQRKLRAGENGIDVALSGNGQAGAGFLHVLQGQRGAGRGGELIRQPDAEGRTDLGAFLRERVIVSAVDAADEVQLLMQDHQRSVGDLIDVKKSVSHGEGSLSVRARLPKPDGNG